jgi:hypothetical protein
VQRGLATLALTVAACALAPSAATAGTVTCPPGPTYTINPGDPPVALQGACTGNALVYSSVSGPGHGSLVGTPDGAATYTPDVNFAGTDLFTYRATDNDGDFAEATITFIVSGPPPSGLAPSCPDPVNVFVPAGGSVLLTGNCSDPDFDAITYGIVPGTGPTPGSLSIVSGNQVQYTPPVGVTSDSFRYSADDLHGNMVTAQVLLTVTPPGTTEVSTGTTPTAADPFVAGVETSTARPVTVGERPTSVAPPIGFFLLGTEFNIVVTPDDQTIADPLRLTFSVDASRLPPDGIVVPFRNGQAIETACDGSGQAAPDDPCVESAATLGDGSLRIVVLSSHASRWNLGYRKPVDTDNDGRIDSADNCPAVANPSQANNDGDSAGDACDADDDNDGVPDTADACKTVAGAAQNGCPLPTDKDQCKNDGWRNYGTTFKSQGACVSSIAKR